MNRLLTAAFTSLLFAISGCKTSDRCSFSTDLAAATPAARTVEAACATCIFQMKDVKGCKLAVKIDGKAYLVTGSDIDDHGDAHAANGLCNTARDALVEGKIEGDRFIASRFELRPG